MSATASLGLTLLSCALLTGCFCVGDSECVDGVGVTFVAQGEAPESYEVCFNGACTGERPFVDGEYVPLDEVGMFVRPWVYGGRYEVTVLDQSAEYTGDATVIRDGDVVHVRLLRGPEPLLDDEFVVDYGRHAACDCTHRTIDLGAL